ncbi:hypothetical protein TNCV_4659931 [Trichonephila clavipes]|uniref:Uncharacterized protein n=1 Tax=Trichonephila clavipes TaxID=2585209 RepID=A0A8X6SCF0_TRICX|nr:hypothetical protein TNCV_4659931 [Trichonephila clavipes]
MDFAWMDLESWSRDDNNAWPDPVPPSPNCYNTSTRGFGASIHLTCINASTRRVLRYPTTFGTVMWPR